MAKVMKTMDGNTAASYVSYAFTDVTAIYPITPSSTMAEIVDEWSANGKKNIFGQRVLVTEMQSEAGAAGAVHGSLQAGALTTTYTASQGLLLMIPNMYKIAGELLPGVFHVSARALASHALSIFGDHQDVMAARQTGFALLASGSVQEVMDLGGIAHLASIKGRVPFLHFFDGFRTSHEIQKIECIDYADFERLLDKDAVKEFRNRALNPNNPVTRGTAQNPDIYFQGVEASNPFYENIVEVTNDYMKEISKLTGREYKPFNYYGHPEAERVIVAMGSATETIEETVDHLIAKGEKVGVIKVHLYRPFSAKYFFDVFPSTVKKIAVLDRTKEKGAIGEPLYLDVVDLFYNKEERPVIVGGRYGLGSKDTTPSQILAVYENLKLEEPKHGFTIGIVDDVTFKSLEIKETINTEPKGTIKCKFWGFGSDGTVGANKQAIKIIGDDTDMYAQGYFSYDSKKSGGVTISHLRFGNSPIKATYLITEPDFISCSKQSYVYQYDLLRGLKKGGTFLLNCIWDEKELEDNLPANMKKYIAENDINFYTINATRIASDIGLGGRTNMIMQSAFFKLAEVLPIDEAVEHLKKSIVDAYGKKGEKIVNMNYEAVDKGIESLVKVNVPEAWKNATEEEATNELPDFIKNVVEPINRQEGDDLPVSTFVGREDGTFPNGTTEYEKRAIAVDVPHWIKENCIQCNQCSYVCPHATIRPFLVDADEKANAPETFETLKPIGKGSEGLEYRIQVSPLDCTGCGNCADVCPAKEKALVMTHFEDDYEVESKNWEFAMTVKAKGDNFEPTTLKNTQFQEPLLQFSGACAGCGETPYAKLMTQLFGDRMLIANATGCSSIWGASAPATSYCVNQEGKGPAWANSLFEDNAEFGYGMAVANRQVREKIEFAMKEFIELGLDSELNQYFNEWIEGINDAKASKAATGMILPRLGKDCGNARGNELLKQIEELKDYLIKKSVWILGGDGWAYDIGFGGLDHVLASGEDINILVFDTEVYSNTGGQSSKATPTAAVAKFAAAGKQLRKKDLGMIAATYGYVYVAQIAMGSNMNQTLKAFREAESYDGPSLIIAYAPCINHGIRTGMGTTIRQEKKAVEAGYWHLYRFDPRLSDEGKNPFVLDSKEPTASFQDFINSEVRYTSLKLQFPEEAEVLFAEAEKNAKLRYESYKRMARD
ncbi:pyruvate:ferredoxin (flavodoxin) oxidoreductase [Tissierella sp. Yu-01]|uniref:pyruvate:ferredoxin (flavodoxin) oxidoreductase n=1 Tax=Tissierella sp. Yu-01 TaxID=3035694 RepID=UPI00240D84C6|nr:pyruvate:ferredoxin (flavodoxin) oxidoreductase [Tissierella sp. Yu-01]WFA09162.1 pyruvate:ferredoxin (flavodoxin) oxidoreductase [Tissierella sp. Yu-01]